MPTFRDLRVTIHTPFAIEGLPEIAAPLHGNHDSKLEQSNNKASVLVSAQPQSLFWISYQAAPREDSLFYVLKLYINGQHVVTWCCDEEQEWEGKVQFGLFDEGKENSRVIGGAGVEKRVFQFSEGNRDGADEGRTLEVRVYRASQKMRMPRKLDYYVAPTPGNGIGLQSAGQTKRGHPRKFYTFILADPLDNPHAIFRFYYSTLGMTTTTTGRSSRKATKQKTDSSPLRTPKQVPVNIHQPTNPSRRISRLPTAVRHSTPPARTPPPTPAPTGLRVARSAGEINMRRLSIPPSTILRPLIEHGPMPASPTKTPPKRGEHGKAAGMRSFLRDALNR